MIEVVFRNGPCTSHMKLHPKVFITVAKYLLKQKVDTLLVDGRSITLRGIRVYVDGQATTWAALQEEIVG